MFHGSYLLPYDKKILGHGSLAVEFFFLVSGYLMMSSLHKGTASSKNLYTFIFHKIKGFWPELFVSIIIAIVVYRYTGHSAIQLMIESLNTFISSLLLLKMTGMTISPYDLNGPTWYLSSMIIGICITYPLLRRFGTHVLLLLGALWMCGYMLKQNGVIASAYTWTTFTYSGNIRAVSELLLGAFAWQSAIHLKTVQLGILTRICLTITKWLGILFVFFISQVGWNTWDGACIVALWLVVVISFSEQSLDGKLYRNKFCFNLGALSLPLYLSHRVWTNQLGKIIDISNVSRLEFFMILCVLSFVSALLTMYGAKLLRKYSRKLASLIVD